MSIREKVRDALNHPFIDISYDSTGDDRKATFRFKASFGLAVLTVLTIGALWVAFR